MYGGYKSDPGTLEYVAMGFGLVLCVGVWMWLGGLPRTPTQWWFRLGVLGVGAGGLATCLVMMKRRE